MAEDAAGPGEDERGGEGEGRCAGTDTIWVVAKRFLCWLLQVLGPVEEESKVEKRVLDPSFLASSSSRPIWISLSSGLLVGWMT